MISNKTFDEIQVGASASMQRTLTKRDIDIFGVLCGDMNPTHFSDEYAAAVEQKQIAEQTALQAFFVVEQKKQEAEQARQVAQGKADSVVIEAKGNAEARLIEAEAESKALEYIAKVIKDNPDLLSYQYISKLSPGIQVMVLPSDSPFLYTVPEMDPLTTTQ